MWTESGKEVIFQRKIKLLLKEGRKERRKEGKEGGRKEAKAEGREKE